MEQIMELIDLNSQILYYNVQNVTEISLNMMYFGYKQFVDSYLYQNRRKLEKLCAEFSPLIMPDKQVLFEFSLNKLIDSIRVSICFENYLKSELLWKEVVIHKLDRNVFPMLSKEQFNRPILTKEILATTAWEMNSALKNIKPEYTYQVKGISVLTIGMKEMLSKPYLDIIGFPKDILEIGSPFFTYRNNLHFYIQESGSLSQNDYTNLCILIEFLNKNIVGKYNHIAQRIGSSMRLRNLEI